VRSPHWGVASSASEDKRHRLLSVQGRRKSAVAMSWRGEICRGAEGEEERGESQERCGEEGREGKYTWSKAQ
jgi:hypothetical protein